MDDKQSAFSAKDEEYLSLCLSLCRRQWGLSGANPAVAAMLATPDQVIDVAITAVGGRPHAEEILLARQPNIPNNASLYLSLEPCAHHSAHRSLSCAENIVEAGIKRVVVGCLDPDPRTNGLGLELIKKRTNGAVKVLLACPIAPHAQPNREQKKWQGLAKESYHGFTLRLQRHRPLVAIKMALSADGKTIIKHQPAHQTLSMAASPHHQITRGQLQFFAQYIRCLYDGLLVSANTVLADNPLLTIRERGLPILQKPRFILDSQNRLTGRERIFQTAESQPLIIFSAQINPALPAAHHVTQIILGADEQSKAGYFSWAAILEKIAEMGVSRLLIETGGQLLSSLRAGSLVDELWLCEQSDVTLGAAGACPLDIKSMTHGLTPDVEMYFDQRQGKASKYNYSPTNLS